MDCDPQNQVFQNELILEKIFKKLEFTDKKSFRLLNRKCMTDTLRKWRKEVVVHINNSIPAKNWKNFIQFTREVPNERFQLIETPFRRYRLSHVKFKLTAEFGLTEIWFKRPSMPSFWEEFGAHMELLEFTEGKLVCGDALYPLKWVILNLCKNLKILSIKNTELVEMTSDCWIEKKISVGNATFYHHNNAGVTPLQKLELGGGMQQNDNIQGFSFQNVKLSLRLDSKLEVGGTTVPMRFEPQKFRDLLNTFPKLKEMTLSSGSYDLAESLMLLCPDGNYTRLESLTLTDTDRFAQDMLKILTRYANLTVTTRKAEESSLKRFNITNGIVIYDGPIYQERLPNAFTFVSVCADSLTHINICVNITLPKNSLTWFKELNDTFFPQLTELYLEFKVIESHKHHGATLKFDWKGLRGMPLLKKFTCIWKIKYYAKGACTACENDSNRAGCSSKNDNGRSYNELNRLEKDSWIHDFQLEHLEALHYDLPHNFGKAPLQELGRIAKNLKTVKLVLAEQNVPIVLEALPKLNLLILLKGSSVQDENLQKIKQEMNSSVTLIFES